MENKTPFSRSILFKFLTQPEVISTISSINADDMFAYYQKERPSNNFSTIYDALSKDLEEIIDSNFFNTDIMQILRNIKDTWHVSKLFFYVYTRGIALSFKGCKYLKARRTVGHFLATYGDCGSLIGCGSLKFGNLRAVGYSNLNHSTLP